MTFVSYDTVIKVICCYSGLSSTIVICSTTSLSECVPELLLRISVFVVDNLFLCRVSILLKLFYRGAAVTYFSQRSRVAFMNNSIATDVPKDNIL